MAIKNYQIHEWKSLKDDPTYPDNVERSAVVDSFIRYSQRLSPKKTIGNFDARKIANENADNIRNSGNNVGIIEFENYRLEFRPKLDFQSEEDTYSFWTFLPHMLSSLSNMDEFNDKLFLDPSRNIRLPKGCNIVPLLALSYVSLLQKVMEKGLLKKYILKEERLKSIKGKINFPSLYKKTSWDLSKVPCSYYDLTFNNPENQIILWCANKLLRESRKIKQNDQNFVIRRLREQYTVLSTEIDLLPKNTSDLLSINISGMNAYYANLMNVCVAILKESLFCFDKGIEKENEGINFIIDMDWVFEQYMTHLFEKVAEEINKEENTDFRIESQQKNRLCDRNKIKIRPDLVIYKGKVPVSIIDFKWKIHEKNNNADFYQIICYGLAELQKHKDIYKIKANLLSVSEINDKPNEVDKISQIFNNEKEITISKIPLFSNLLNNNDSKVVEGNIKDFIQEYLETFI